MENHILKEKNQRIQAILQPKAYFSPLKPNKNKNDENFSPDKHPVIRNISVKSNEIK